MENVISIELCGKCNGCCKNYPFIELSQSEVDALVKATGLPVNVFAIAKGRVVEEYFLQFQASGACFFLNEEGGHYSCSVYAARPGICASYPSNPKQQATCDLIKKNS